MSSTPVLTVSQLSIKRSGKTILENISFTLNIGEALAITGPAGCGKTSLGLALAQQLYYQGSIIYHLPDGSPIARVEQQHHFKTLQSTTDLYYQQRFNSYDTEETQTVAESLGAKLPEARTLIDEMGIAYLLEEKLIQLSNGENKKLQLLNALLGKPAVLIMDQPFTGLDSGTRKWLHEQIIRLKETGVLVVVISSADEIPVSVDKVIFLENGRMQSMEDNVTLHQKPVIEQTIQVSPGPETIPLSSEHPVFNSIIDMEEVSVRYGDKLILDRINWRVLPGECWLLTGPNGAGKSTLLSLVNGDNPQAYANKIHLFGQRRGSGESIWDIKKKTGFLSPELHVYFNESSTGFETVASGLFDTIGLFRQVSAADTEWVMQWMEVCRISLLKNKRLFELSNGEQRMLLLARALVKDPPLLILDEPCQGLDPDRKHRLLELINRVCTVTKKTLVFVSHYEKDVPACVDNYLRIEKGRRVS
jgi:molybdate transport system ATP-binding protein